MKSIINAFLTATAILAFASIAFSQDLTITGGDVKIIEVDRVIVVKDKVQVVSTFPFKINAPAATAMQVSLYAWKIPPNVMATDDDHVLTITAAPKGSLTVSVKYILIDTAPVLKVTKKELSISFAVGSPSPKPPDDPPIPISIAKHLSFIGPTTATAGVVTDVGLRDYLKSHDVTVHVLAANSPHIEASKLTAAVAKAGGTPCLVIQDASGHVLDQAKITTVEAVKNIIKPFVSK